MIPGVRRTLSADTHAAFAHEDQQRSRSLVAGGREDAPGSLRVRLVYLDEEPVETSSRIAAVEADLGTPGAGEVLLSTPVSTIVPWQDW